MNKNLLIAIIAVCVTVLVAVFVMKSNNNTPVDHEASAAPYSQPEVSVPEVRNEKPTLSAVVNSPSPEEVRKTEVANNLEKYIHIKVYPNAKKLGGYNKFILEVNNDSDYAIDYYSVNIDVYQQSGALYATKKGEIYNVPAHSKKQVQLGGTGRGASYKLSNPVLYSNELGNGFQGEE